MPAGSLGPGCQDKWRRSSSREPYNTAWQLRQPLGAFRAKLSLKCVVQAKVYPRRRRLIVTLLRPGPAVLIETHCFRPLVEIVTFPCNAPLMMSFNELAFAVPETFPTAL